MSYNLVQADGSLKNIAGGGGDTSIELTQAEYDALKEAGELKADTNYFVKDAEGGGGSSANVIDDTTISDSLTWSSSKINEKILTVGGNVDALLTDDKILYLTIKR